jgi:CheY-like chemotaxis protein
MSTTILLADDSITIQKVVGIIFANEEFDLVVVDNGNAALEKAREIRPSVMLVDALMPGKNGYEVCEEVRRDPLIANTPLLLLVGAFEPFDEDKARKSGADDFITKPFESQNLIDKVKTLVELAATRSAVVPEHIEEPLLEVAAPIEVATSQPEETSARLAESFRSFVHLGGEAPPVPEAAATVEDTALSEQAQPPVSEPEPQGVILLSSVDIVEASPEDDLWGTFAEEIPEEETVHFGEVIDETGEGELSTPVEEIESIALMDEEPVAVLIGAEPEAVVKEPEAIQEGVFGYDTFAITGREERPVFEEAPEPVEAEETLHEPGYESRVTGETISLGEEPEPVPAESRLEAFESPASIEEEAFESIGLVQEEVDLQFAPEEEYVPAAEAFAALQEAPVAAVEAPPSEAVPPVQEARITISEAQLAEAISRISKEIIEKIAWDVVPDLAETIIKEEIRKIKEGMAR